MSGWSFRFFGKLVLSRRRVLGVSLGGSLIWARVLICSEAIVVFLRIGGFSIF